jgi:hypothetical protein
VGPIASCTARMVVSSPAGSSLVTNSRPTNLHGRVGTTLCAHCFQRPAQAQDEACKTNCRSVEDTHLRSSVGPRSSSRHSARPAASCSGVVAAGTGAAAALWGLLAGCCAAALGAASPMCAAETCGTVGAWLPLLWPRKPAFISAVTETQAEQLVKCCDHCALCQIANIGIAACSYTEAVLL